MDMPRYPWIENLPRMLARGGNFLVSMLDFWGVPLHNLHGGWLGFCPKNLVFTTRPE